ncbi:MAG: hypothetical protein ACR2K6_00680 [Solirubrobacterales bacterium]
MRYERTDSFKRDYGNLSEGERQAFREAVRERFLPALEARERDPGRSWPRELRVKGVKGARGVWELTWSFTDPDGRATWEWTKIEGEPAIRWRRVGSHRIFEDP